jgi:hypothetical protein
MKAYEYGVKSGFEYSRIIFTSRFYWIKGIYSIKVSVI